MQSTKMISWSMEEAVRKRLRGLEGWFNLFYMVSEARHIIDKRCVVTMAFRSRIHCGTCTAHRARIGGAY